MANIYYVVTPKKEEKNNYDWAIVLGGTKYVIAASQRFSSPRTQPDTNPRGCHHSDLAIGVSDTEIFHTLKAVWDVPLRRNIKVLALTVPEPGVKVSAVAAARRKALNNAIKGYKRTNL